MARNERKILVFGDDTRSFLTTVRSLARKGVEVHAAPFDVTAPALESRYIAQIHWLPYYLEDGGEWLTALRDILEKQRIDLVIPCDERALLPLYRHREELSALSRLAIPDERALDILYDKHKTRELARSLGIPVAAGRLITDGDTPRSILSEVALPLVIKPRRSYELADLYSRGRVTIVADETALAESLPSARGGTHFFESFFPGQGGGVSVLAHQGRVLQAFEHHRVHERGGSGYYRVSARLSVPLADAASRIVAALAYTGLAMFEFKIDREALTWILLEVNARPWGSLPLPVGLGVDFPYDWYRLLMDGVETPPHPYKTGIYARNLLPDMLAVLAEAKDYRWQPRRLALFLLRTLWDYHRLLTGREFHDVLVWDDPRPGLSEFGGILREAAQRLLAVLPGAGRRSRRRDRLAVESAVRAAGNGPFLVVFVCQGNICRSPFAEQLLRSRVDGAAASGASRITARSAGMLPRRGKESPPAAIEAARRFGVDLSPHRSDHLSRGLAESASLLVVFDSKNLRWLRQRYAHLPAPVVFLGSFADGETAGGAIDDPDGGDPSLFSQTYARIAGALDGLFPILRNAEKN